MQIVESDLFAALFARSAAFRLLQCMCQTLDVESIKALVGGPEGTKVSNSLIIVSDSYIIVLN